MPMVLNSIHAQALLGVWEISESADFFEQAIAYRSLASNPGHRLQQLASRMLLDVLHPGFPFSQVSLNSAGKPFIEKDTLQFSISHTKGFAAAIITDKTTVGIDIECISSRVLRIEKKFLSEHEFMMLDKFSSEDRIVFASLFWSIKETVYKCWGKGGVDFSGGIRIISFIPTEMGFANVQFGAHPQVHHVHYQRMGDIWLSHMQGFIK